MVTLVIMQSLVCNSKCLVPELSRISLHHVDLTKCARQWYQTQTSHCQQETVNRCKLFFFLFICFHKPQSHFAYSSSNINLHRCTFSKFLTVSSARQGKNLNYIMPFDSNTCWCSLVLNTIQYIISSGYFICFFWKFQNMLLSTSSEISLKM